MDEVVDRYAELTSQLIAAVYSTAAKGYRPEAFEEMLVEASRLKRVVASKRVPVVAKEIEHGE